MLKYVKGICKGCGKETYIQNKTKTLCSECVFKLNHKGKSKYEVFIEKKRKSRINFKTTGEKELFLEIWLERPHICENCKSPLGNEPKIWMFAHIIPKSVNELLRLVKKNIRLLCFECHDALDKQGEFAYEKRRKS